jgi:hypothetical protein
MKPILALRIALALTLSLPLAALSAGPARPLQKGAAALAPWAGEWTSEAEIVLEPGKPPLKSKGTERSRMVGPHWLLAEGESDVMGMPYRTASMIGYDAKREKFVATTIDSMSDYQWRYEGTLDATGKVLTLEADGPAPYDPSQKIRMREVYELKTPDHKVFTVSSRGQNGRWVTVATIQFHRKK